MDMDSSDDGVEALSEVPYRGEYYPKEYGHPYKDALNFKIKNSFSVATVILFIVGSSLYLAFRVFVYHEGYLIAFIIPIVLFLFIFLFAIKDVQKDKKQQKIKKRIRHNSKTK